MKHPMLTQLPGARAQDAACLLRKLPPAWVLPWCHGIYLWKMLSHGDENRIELSKTYPNTI